MHRTEPSGGSPTRDELLAWYRQMVTIRRSEETIARLFNEGLVYGTAHLSIGQEAVPVGVCAALTEADYLTTTYRGHGWAIAKGVPLDEFFAELFGRDTGLCRGRGGSMHICDMRVGLIGASGIVGGGIPIAVGSALAAQVQGTDAVSVASFGDGATNIGAFHEALNLAAVWQLPAIFVCENNLYGEFTPARDTCLLEDLARRADAYGIPGVVVDGNDVVEVNRVAQAAVARARAGEGPTLIEAKTYRHRGHSRNDPARYRPPEELEEWLLRDPITALRAELRSQEWWDDEAERLLIENVDSVIGEAVQRAKEAEFPVAATVSDYVFSEPDGQTDRVTPTRSAPPGSSAPPRLLSYREAVREALAEELERDERVILFGEDVARAGGVFKVTEGLYDRFGPERVRDTPISENALVGAAIGAAAAGLVPVVEIMFADFLANALDQVANHLAKLQFMSGGRLRLPVVIRAAHGGGIRFGGQHSQASGSWLLPFPGIKIVVPATPEDAKSLLIAAIRDPNPVLVLEHKALYGVKGEVSVALAARPLGEALIKRAGAHLTLVGLGATVAVALDAAEHLGEAGVEAEVIDLRCLVPLDSELVIDSVRRTGTLLVVEEEPGQGGWAAQIVSLVAQRAWSALLESPVVISAANTPVPYSPLLEDAYLPSVERVVAAGEALVAKVGTV